MELRAAYPHDNSSFDDGRRASDDALTPGFLLGERIGPPPARRNGLLILAVLLSLVLGGAWVIAKTGAPVNTWIASAAAYLMPSAPPPQQRLSETPGDPVIQQPVKEMTEPAKDIAAAPGESIGEAVPAPATPAAAETAAAPEPPEEAPEKPVEEGKIEPLPPPVADPADPYQKRALEAGLHPDLSRAVLAKLTDADYKNAATAIKTALAATPDNEVLTWPKKPSAKLALFEVKFVKGAGETCRRYVVTVTKDRWSTTARAMEKCGADRPKRKTVKVIEAGN